jgi:two-component system, NarL family, response regulator DegU
MEKITVILVDDHPLFRQGVVNALNLEPDIEVMDQASDGAEGLDIIRKQRPRIAILDVNLPSMNGHQITQQIVLEKMPTAVVLMTAYDDLEQKIYAMRSGAMAYCTKDILPEDLIKILKKALNGIYVIGEHEFTKQRLKTWMEEQTAGSMRYVGDVIDSFQPLSAREVDVLKLLSQGYSNKEIAMQLRISQQTVKNHVTSILHKLGVEDRTQAVLYAVKRGWVRLYEQGEKQEE